MKFSSVFYYAASLALLDLGSARALPTSQGPSAQQEIHLFPRRCYPDPCKNIKFDPAHADSICGDVRLGPVVLPRRFPVSNELRTYSRFGGLCPDEFILKWTGNLDPSVWFKYPEANGFTIDTNGNPIMADTTFTVGRKFDRFGNPTGTFLAPLGAPYIERSLPPPNLAPGSSGNYPYNYHVYEVMKEFKGGLGPVASWFGQPGFGSQILTYMSVGDLVAQGFLRELEESEFDEAVEYSYEQPRNGSSQA
ncbi:hypothetical protein FQN49_007761 [Arthroderma sp. PD_2]|nr:hypothetical protein FQN49_007761 [Arthroderma sp. PD_2]